MGLDSMDSDRYRAELVEMGASDEDADAAVAELRGRSQSGEHATGVQAR